MVPKVWAFSPGPRVVCLKVLLSGYTTQVMESDLEDYVML